MEAQGQNAQFPEFATCFNGLGSQTFSTSTININVKKKNKNMLYYANGCYWPKTATICIYIYITCYITQTVTGQKRPFQIDNFNKTVEDVHGLSVLKACSGRPGLKKPVQLYLVDVGRGAKK